MIIHLIGPTKTSLIKEKHNMSSEGDAKVRSKRSLANLLDAWISGFAVTGLRIQYYPEKVFFEVVGDADQVG